MKLVFCYILFWINCFLGFSQAPVIEWQKTLGGDSGDNRPSIKQTSDGGTIICGPSGSDISGDKTVSNESSQSDIWLIKTNAIGDIEWQKALGGSGGEGPSRIIITNDGGYLLVTDSSSNISGEKSENSYGLRDYWVVKLDNLGNVEWDKTLGGNQYDLYPEVIQTQDGGYIIAGTSNSNISGVKTENCVGCPLFEVSGEDYWIIKLDANGAIEWQNTIGGNFNDFLYSIITLPDGGFLVGGTSGSGIGGDKTDVCRGESDYWLLKLNSVGSIIWQKTYGGSSFDNLKAMAITPDNCFLLAGTSSSTISGEKTINPYNNNGTVDIWVLKINATGDIIWQKVIGGSQEDSIEDIVVYSNGDFILGSTSYSPISFDKTEDSRGSTDYWIVKCDNAGNILWDKTIGGDQPDGLREINRTNDNGLLIIGTSLSSVTGDKTDVSRGLTDFWVIKLEPDMLLNTTFVENNFYLYPNPVKDEVNINLNYFTKETAVTVTNVFGQIILNNMYYQTDKIIFNLNGESGLYFITIKNEFINKTLKLVKK